MSQVKEPNNVELQFKWGIKRGIGGAKKDVQFYESFTFDGVDYNLYDSVYLFKKGDSEPYIGIIVKIWEQDHKKKVKILWFFRSNEILNYLGDQAPSEKEIFLASGEGVGLANVNPLEAIAGKCSVICTSKDERNPQPSKDALEKAEYIFYRTFDVGTYTISDKLADKIAGVEVKLLFNRNEDHKPCSVSKPEANGLDEYQKADASSPVPFNLSKSDSLNSLGNKVKPEHAIHSVSKNEDAERKQPNEGKRPHEISVPKSKTDASKNAKDSINSAKDRCHLDICDERPPKKIRLSDDSGKLSDDLQKNNRASGARNVKIGSDESDSGKASTQLQNVSSEKRKLSEKKVKLSDESLQKASPLVSKVDSKAEHQTDRSKWFKGMPWEGRMLKANEHGTLVFLENFDRSVTAADIEAIIYQTFNQSCTAKVMPELPINSPHYGQAYVIFKTQEAANMAVQKIGAGCLMLTNGRPITASKGILKMPPKLSTLPGHLVVDKIKIQMKGEDMRRAVSTSHCSQPNTIEYEMAMEWFLAQEKSVNWYQQLFKHQRNEWKQISKNLKSNG